ncbi:hypothetical protein BH09VER1_BH09VER1_26190 [soil metagenome]
MSVPTPNSSTDVTPRWLAKARALHGAAISEADASLLYRPEIEWEAHSKMCKKREIERIRSLIAEEDHPQEKEVFYVSSFNMLDQFGHRDLALDIGYQYLLAFTEGAPEFPKDAKPPALILKRMAILYEQAGQYDLAIWACDMASHFGINDDGTKRGVSGRREKLVKSQAGST